MTPNPRSPEDAGDGYSFTFDPTAENQPAMTIVEAVAWVKGVGLRDLQPLHELIDTEMLNRGFDRSTDSDFYRSSSQPATSGPKATFEYEGCAVTVTADRVRLEVILR